MAALPKAKMKLDLEFPIRIESERSILCERAIEINGQRLRPDETKAYLEFFASRAFPSVTAYRSAWTATTVERSHQSLRHQVLNLEHRIAQYYKGTSDEGRVQDKVLGSIVEVEFPRRPAGGWRLTDLDHAPVMRGVAVLHKQITGADRIIGRHQSGRHDWQVSLELRFRLVDSGIVLRPPAGDRAAPKELPEEFLAQVSESTPGDFRDAGYWYLPFVEAPDGLLDCFNENAGMFDKLWRGWEPITLAGGLDGQMHYMGVGLVDYGAEPGAGVSEILASHPHSEVVSGLEGIVSALEKFEA